MIETFIFSVGVGLFYVFVFFPLMDRFAKMYRRRR